uniref:Threonine--tRNA ligase n=1 Tax=candidate division WOR-3 bacterium TaxID=2052148 RepID=A0A7C4UDD7_UNCW3
MLLIYKDKRYNVKEIKNILNEINNKEFFKEFFGFKSDNLVYDFHTDVENGEYELIPSNSEEGNEIRWHTSSHILAQAVLRLFPDAKQTIGPAIKNGFYYDFFVDNPFTPEDIKKIEDEMMKIVKEDYPIERKVIKKEEAKDIFKNNKFKLELIDEIEGDSVTIYKQGEFVDLCRGPHLLSTGLAGEIKILSVSSAYWRGDERRESLQRIYGISFENKKKLDDFIKAFEEAKRNDHRILGKELGIFTTFEETGPGLIFWEPNGAIIKMEIEKFLIEEHLKRGYQIVSTPHISRDELFRISGHLDFYKDNMYLFKIDEEGYAVKPMNCPGHILIYKSKLHSYRELPIKYFELGTVYRYERSGTLHGLLRVRGFTIDDAHIFCTKEQLKNEINEVFDFSVETLKTFGYENITVYVATRDPKSKELFAGSDEEWEMAESTLKSILKERNIPFKEEVGGAVFYGPKISIFLVDSIGREWQGPTIQFDFNIPRRFNIQYVGEDGKMYNPYMVHRAILGSMERFIGGLIEFYKGNFPLWLSPVQVAVLTVTDEGIHWAENVNNVLKGENIRVKLDTRNEKITKKIKEAEMLKIPYMAIIGKKEKENGTISLRKHKEGEIGIFQLSEVVKMLKEEILKRR